MPGFVHFLRCVGKAVVKNAGKALASLVPFGEVSYEIAKDAWEDFRRDSSEAELRAELEQLAQAPQSEVRQVAEEVAAGNPPRFARRWPPTSPRCPPRSASRSVVRPIRAVRRCPPACR